MGMCIWKEHFLEICRIFDIFAQAILMNSNGIKKTVSLVSLVSTVSFRLVRVYSYDNNGRLRRAQVDESRSGHNKFFRRGGQGARAEAHDKTPRCWQPEWQG